MSIEHRLGRMLRELVFGPYAHGRCWRVVMSYGGKRIAKSFPTKERAEAFKNLYEKDVQENPIPVEVRYKDLWPRISYTIPTGESVYFIGVVGRNRVKIGISNNPKRRLAELQHARGDDTLVLLGVLPGGRSLEFRLHRLFDDDRLGGEWFRCSRRMSRAMRLLFRVRS